MGLKMKSSPRGISQVAKRPGPPRRPAKGNTSQDTLVEGPGAIYGIVGKDPRLLEVVALIQKIAESNILMVLIDGETGAGKEVVARAIHLASPQKDAPFIEIDCAVIPETLLESELMGHEPGAFTDAKTRKMGLLELADGGTVLLNEISEIPLKLQVKLLRVVEMRSFKRVGGTKDIHIEARIIAATNHNLEEMVGQGSFRKDLYYRLKVISIHLPALRARKDDIPILTDHFIRLFNSELDSNIRGISEEAKDLLRRYFWPGNVRELRNALERAVFSRKEGIILPQDLPGAVRSAPIVRSHTSTCGIDFELPPEGINLDEFERDFIRQSLELSANNQVRAAKLLGIGRDALRYRMKKYGIDTA